MITNQAELKNKTEKIKKMVAEYEEAKDVIFTEGGLYCAGDGVRRACTCIKNIDVLGNPHRVYVKRVLPPSRDYSKMVSFYYLVDLIHKKVYAMNLNGKRIRETISELESRWGEDEMDYCSSNHLKVNTEHRELSEDEIFEIYDRVREQNKIERKTFDEVDYETLKYLSWEVDMTDGMIGNIYGVTKQKVATKRAKWGLQLYNRALMQVMNEMFVIS